ncbi:hypothetical protein CBER1_06978 [Cercospora berteroae]|uniref:Uncharacterized protein n=1 Tax=Cercospora berteroae TaxID=357750 RepID=A0A2S6BSE9_9PEZI|nr:hypothetical protein CBER1_06978 [Cercospora berteroae]
MSGHNHDRRQGPKQQLLQTETMEMQGHDSGIFSLGKDERRKCYTPRHGPFLPSMRLWWFEVLGMVTSVAALLAIFGILFAYSGEPLSAWKAELRPNTIVAVLSTLSKSAMLMVVAQCIGQLKWLYFAQRPHPLQHIEIFDDASRGPLGSAKLLVHVNWTALLASLGAIITLLSLAMDPFVQQVISYDAVTFNDTTAQTFLSTARAYDTGLSYATSGTIDSDGSASSSIGFFGERDPNIAGAIYKGVFGDMYQSTVDCASGNCTWAEENRGWSGTVWNASAMIYNPDLPGKNRLLTKDGTIATIASVRYHDVTDDKDEVCQEIEEINAGQVLECSLKWCVKTYNATAVQNGILSDAPSKTEALDFVEFETCNGIFDDTQGFDFTISSYIDETSNDQEYRRIQPAFRQNEVPQFPCPVLDNAGDRTQVMNAKLQKAAEFGAKFQQAPNVFLVNDRNTEDLQTALSYIFQGGLTNTFKVGEDSTKLALSTAHESNEFEKLMERVADTSGKVQNKTLQLAQDHYELSMCALRGLRAHSLTLERTTQQVIAQLNLGGLFSIDNGVSQVRYIESMPETRQALTRVLMAILTLKNSGMCQGSINAIVESPNRQDTAEVFEFDQSDISALLVLLNTHSPDIGTTLTARRELEEDVPEDVARLLVRRSDSLDHLMPPGGTKRWTWSYLCFFTAFVTLATASYAGAHVNDGGGELPVDYVVFDSLVQRDPEFIEKFYSFRRRRLSCLDSFLQGPVWVIGSHNHEDRALCLAIEIGQFAALWGPVYALPDKGEFDRLMALSVENGFMYRTPDTGHLRKGEVAVHYTATGRTRKIDDLHNQEKGRWATSNGHGLLPESLVPFDVGAKLLIGTPTAAHTDSVVGINTQSKHAPKSPPTDFSVTQLDLVAFAQDHASQIVELGVLPRRYLPDALSLSMSFGKWVNPGFSKTYKLDRGRTQKERLLDFVSKSTSRLSQILDVKIGLEVSLHTYNARRITLHDAPGLAFPELEPILAEAHSTRDNATLATHLDYLGDTGLDHDDHLVIYWPYATGLPKGLKMSATPPSWHKMMRDTISTSCFAVASTQCLAYTGNDSVKDKTLMTSTTAPALQTDIQVHSDCNITTPLRCKAVLRLDSGTLELRNNEVQHQLAYFRDNSIINKLGGTWRAFLIGSGSHVHQELVGAARRSRHTVSVCVVDVPSGMH